HHFLSHAEGTDLPVSEFVGEVASIAGEEDIYSFKAPLQKLDIATDLKKASIEVDLDTASESMSCVLRFTQDNKTRYLPLSLSFSGEIESLQIDTLDDQSVRPEVAQQYRELIVRAIQSEATNKREADIRRARLTSRRERDSEPVELQTATLSRDERMVLYA